MNPNRSDQPRKIMLNLDLEHSLDETGAWKSDMLQQWTSLGIDVEADPAVDVISIGLFSRIKLPAKIPCRIPMSELLVLALKAMRDKVEENALEYRYSIPIGFRDLVLKMCYLSDRWIIRGERKAEVADRKPSLLHPSRSIDLHRNGDPERSLISSDRLPDLDYVWLKIEKDAKGRQHVLTASKTPPQDSEKLSDWKRFQGELDLEWPAKLHFDLTVLRFLENYSLRECGVEPAVFQEFRMEMIWPLAEKGSARDLRATLTSGPCGPAPLPAGSEWPCCEQCEQPLSFITSLDFRDAPFSQLLPGSSLVIFGCPDCFESGEREACTRFFWLPAEAEIELKTLSGDIADPTKISSHRGVIDHEFDRWELPEDLRQNLFGHTRSDIPWIQSPSLMTKVGGIPYYLQADPVFYDSTGCKMEYIGQFQWDELNGCAYIFHSATTGETTAELQTT